MATIRYALGPVSLLDALFPPVELANANVGLTDQCSVVAHYTRQSLDADGFADARVAAHVDGAQYHIVLTADADTDALNAFAAQHQALFHANRAGLAVEGARLLRAFNVWNPMEGFPVNADTDDGTCKWHLFPPLGLNVMGQRGLLCGSSPSLLSTASSISAPTLRHTC